MRRSFLVLALAVALGGCANARSTSSSGGSDRVGPVPVLSVTDGDTIRVRLDGRDTPVRLIGIDTPEKGGPYTHAECYGDEASRHAQELLSGREVELEFDVQTRDRYGRTLAYVWVDDSLVNETILRDGYARVLTIPPDVRYAERFRAAERDARASGRGLWLSCPT